MISASAWANQPALSTSGKDWILPDLGGVTTVAPEVEQRVREGAKLSVDTLGLVEVDVDLALPNLAAQWMMGNLSTLLAELGDLWPGNGGNWSLFAGELRRLAIWMESNRPRRTKQAGFHTGCTS